jgi:hypothetical protein
MEHRRLRSVKPVTTKEYRKLSHMSTYGLTRTDNHQGACTDQTFRSPSCPQYCASNPDLSIYGDVRQCSGSNVNWTCGIDTTECNNPFDIPLGYVDDRRITSQSGILALPAVYTQAGSSGTAVRTVTVTKVATSATGAGQAAATSNLSCGGTSRRTIELGVGLGVGLPLLLLAVAALVLLFREKARVQNLERRLGLPLQNSSRYEKDGLMVWQVREVDGQEILEAPSD